MLSFNTFQILITAMFTRIVYSADAKYFTVPAPVSYTHLDVYKRQGPKKGCRTNDDDDLHLTIIILSRFMTILQALVPFVHAD